MSTVYIYSDGACSGNPGPGGYGVLLRQRDKELELSGGEPETTNNRMELMGVITGLEKLTKPCHVHIISDSRYVVDAFNKHWLDSWQQRGWKGADKKPVKNIDLWQRLLKAAEGHELEFTWIKGHNGHPENERCDALATTAADRAAEENGSLG